MPEYGFSLTYIFRYQYRIVDSVFILKLAGQRKLVFSHILRFEKIKNKPRNRLNSYYYISDDSESTEPHLVPNTVDTPKLAKCPNKELNEGIVNDTENIIHLNLKKSRHNN